MAKGSAGGLVMLGEAGPPNNNPLGNLGMVTLARTSPVAAPALVHASQKT